MAGYSIKNWINEADHAGPPAAPPGTPLSAVALEDMEDRLSSYTSLLAGTATGFHNVVDYGADPSGGSICTTQIQNALNAAGGWGPSGGRAGGCVVFPAGEYLVDAQLDVPTYVQMHGAGKRSSVVKADPTFPVGGTVVRLTGLQAYSGGTASISFDQRIEDMTIDAGGIVDTTCVYSNTANEGSGLFSASVYNFRKYGAHFDGNTAGTFTGASIISIFDLEATGASNGDHTAGVYMNAVHGQNHIIGATVVSGRTPDMVGDGIHVHACDVHLHSIHPEGYQRGIRFTTGATGSVRGAYGLSDVTTLVHLDDSDKHVRLEDLLPNGATNTIYDEVTGQADPNIIQSWESGLHWRDVGGAGEPAFANSWVNYDVSNSTAGFRREGANVQVRGLVKDGTLGQTIFTLPVGFRPELTASWATITGGTALSLLTVASTGAVTVYGGVNSSASIECSFSTADAT